MPPKKLSAKALAAELKKKNTLEAENIVEQLRQETAKSSSGSILKKPIREKSEKPIPVSSIKKRTVQDMDVVTKSNRAVPSVSTQDSLAVDLGVNAISKRAKIDDIRSIESVLTVEAEVEATEHVKTAKGSKLDDTKSAGAASKAQSLKESKTSKSTSKSAVNQSTRSSKAHGSGYRYESDRSSKPDGSEYRSESTRPPKTHGSDYRSKSTHPPKAHGPGYRYHSARPLKAHGSGYHYEIDCAQVADSIDVKDLHKHIEKHLKVDGKKNNLGRTVTIQCEGQKVVVKSETFLPKKCLRFLSKKFLKKNWNIRVLSKNAHSYEYKYVGAP